MVDPSAAAEPVETVALLGGGKMGEALLAGLLRGRWSPADVVVVEKYPERAAQLVADYGVATVDVAEGAGRARTFLLAVKPQDATPLLAELAPALGADRPLVVSVVAGITTAALERVLPAGTAVVRCMPNTPALIGEGMTGIAPGSHATDSDLARAESLLRAVGQVVRVPEPQLDAVTALSGSGPAYFFYLVEAMIEAGVQLGLARPLATQLIVQTAVGSALMLRDSGEHPVQLREAVTSPGGTTAAAIKELDAHRVRAALAAALDAAARRSRELGGS